MCVILSWKSDTSSSAVHAANVTVAPTTGRDAFTVDLGATLSAASPALVTTAWVYSSGECIGS